MEKWKKDAEEFGVHVKQGGWRLGLLVARNVEKGVGQGGNPSVARATDGGKVSGRAFGERAGTSADRVLRYFDGWEAAAADGIVPAAATLTPGQDVDLDVEMLPEWSDYYPPVDGGPNGSKNRPPVRDTPERIVEQITKAPPSERKRIMQGITADPVLNQEVAREIVIKGNDALEAGQRMYREGNPTGEWLVAYNHLVDARNRMKKAVEALAGGTIVDGEEGDVARKMLTEKVTTIRSLIEWVESYIESGGRGMDAELADILKGDAE